jgi:DNA-binding MarR family transcriptional regulator
MVVKKATRNNKNETGQVLHDLFKEVFELHSALSKIMDRVHVKAGFSTSQKKIMQTLNNIESATVPDMAASLGVSRQFVQTVCNDLFALGFLKFSDNPRHKRSKIAALTDRGVAAFQNAQQNENMIIEEAFPDIKTHRIKDAHALLQYIRKRIQSISSH